ncbi:MAG: hypothetical protein ACLP9L_15800 [Thermoguttaceae bacterium]
MLINTKAKRERGSLTSPKRERGSLTNPKRERGSLTNPKRERGVPARASLWYDDRPQRGNSSLTRLSLKKQSINTQPSCSTGMDRRNRSSLPKLRRCRNEFIGYLQRKNPAVSSVVQEESVSWPDEYAGRVVGSLYTGYPEGLSWNQGPPLGPDHSQTAPHSWTSKDFVRFG